MRGPFSDGFQSMVWKLATPATWTTFQTSTKAPGASWTLALRADSISSVPQSSPRSNLSSINPTSKHMIRIDQPPGCRHKFHTVVHIQQCPGQAERAWKVACRLFSGLAAFTQPQYQALSAYCFLLQSDPISRHMLSP